MEDDKATRRAGAIRTIQTGAIVSLFGLLGTWAYPVEWMGPMGLSLLPLLILNLAMYVGPIVLLVGLVKLANAR